MEEWRAVNNYEGLYEVSNLGNVRSLNRKTTGRWGKSKTSPGRTLKPNKMNSGYLRVDLSKNGKVKHFSVHKLVAEEFIPTVKNKVCVNHKDGDRTNNKAENLEWCTHQENTDHAKRNGKMPRLAKCHKGHELTEDNVYVNPRGSRFCRICKSIYQRNYRNQLRAKQREALYEFFGGSDD